CPTGDGFAERSAAGGAGPDCYSLASSRTCPNSPQTDSPRAGDARAARTCDSSFHGCPRRNSLRRLRKISLIQEGRLMTEPLAPEDFPGPPGLPIIGNLRAIDLAQPIDSLMSIAREYGPIFKLTSPAGISAVVSGVDLVSEICDDARFDKVITAGLSILAEGPVDAGLFTAHTDDPMWARAHGILMAPF